MKTKKILLSVLVIVLFPLISNAQLWTGASNPFGEINRSGQVGIGLTDSPNDTQLYVKSNNLKVGIVSETAHNTDFQFGILSAVNRVKTKAFSVLLKNSSGNYEDTFVVMGDGTTIATEVKVKTPIFPDYVFEENYKLPTLNEVETFILENGHLKNIPSAKDVEQNGGINLGGMNVKLLEKIEELTLYLIQQNKQIQELKNKIQKIEN